MNMWSAMPAHLFRVLEINICRLNMNFTWAWSSAWLILSFLHFPIFPIEKNDIHRTYPTGPHKLSIQRNTQLLALTLLNKSWVFLQILNLTILKLRIWKILNLSRPGGQVLSIVALLFLSLAFPINQDTSH